MRKNSQPFQTGEGGALAAELLLTFEVSLLVLGSSEVEDEDEERCDTRVTGALHWALYSPLIAVTFSAKSPESLKRFCRS